MLQGTQRTPDYFSTLLCRSPAVHSSGDSFCPVLLSCRSAAKLVPRYLRLDAFHDHLLHFFDAGFVAFVERPLLDALGAHESGS
jgi:hypothetical protein